MGAKHVQKRGSQSARSSQAGKRSKPKEKNRPPQAGALSSDAIREGKGSDPKHKKCAHDGRCGERQGRREPSHR